MILNETDFFNRLNAYIGDDSSDDAVKFLEDMSDTYNGLKKDLSENDGAYWKQKYEENEASWKKKYKNRFFNSPAINNISGGSSNEDDDVNENIGINDLFKRKG